MRGSAIVPMALAPSSARVLLLMLLSAAIVAAACLLSNASARPAADDGSDTSKLHTGREIYQAACVACHGPDGSGAPKTMVGFEKPATFPVFNQCDQTAPEYTRDWKAVIRDGGPARGFSEIMPAFGDVFTPEQIDKLAEYLRSLCGKQDKERTWPPGELNLPRAMVTEKAFPEDEVVLTTSVAAKGAPGVTNNLTYEYRIDGRNQLEVALPVSSLHRATGGYDTGIGDLAVGLKHVFFWNLDTTPNAVFARSAFGASFSRGFGRQWSPMLELVADRDLHTDAITNWDLVPQFQVTLNTRQHIRADLAYRVAINNTAGRANEVMFYFLWDWFDGGLFEGW
jgi:mono/diheme cytochrome c family protein